MLWGVGLGPGDPDLVTLRAARVIGAAPVVAYPRLLGGESLARSIAAGLIAPGAREIAIDVPMSVAREPAQAAYDRGAAEIAAALDAGQDVAALCEGDALFYGSFMYLFSRLSGRYRVEIVPGVTSLSACAAAAGRPLVAREGAMLVLPGTLPEAVVAARLGEAETVVLMKVGRHMDKLRRAVAAAGLLERAVYVERATLPGQRVCALAEAPREAPYFSMILVSRGADPWL